MMKAIGWIVAIFCILVFFNYISVTLGSILTPGGLAHGPWIGAATPASAASPAGGPLPSINFNFFNPTGTGRDYITQGYGRTPYSYLYINGWHNRIDLAANF